MKLAISNIAWKPEETNRIFDILRKRNVNGIEVAPSLLFEDLSKLSSREIIKVRKFYEAQGIEIVAMQALLYGRPDLCIFAEKATIMKTTQYLENIFKISHYLNAHSLVFGSPKNRRKNNRTNDEIRKMAHEFFYRMGEMAEAYNTKFCIEPNAVEYGCDFITNTMEAIELVKHVDHPGFKLHMDAGVMTMNRERHDKVLRLALPYMSHFHISEPYLQQITENKSDHLSIGKELNQLGYNGWVSIEMKSGFEANNLDVVDKCLEFANRCYINNG